MPDRDKKDVELQVAAVRLSERFGVGRQKLVAEELQKLYASRGAFDNARVSRLCKHAIEAKLATAPSTAKLVPGATTDKWLKQFDETERRFQQLDPVRGAIEKFCSAVSAPVTPIVFVVPGDTNKRRDKPTSEFAENAIDVAFKYLKEWIAANKGHRLKLGVTWGRQLHYVAVAAQKALREGYLKDAALSVMPLVGLPLGGHRRDIMSSSEIANVLACQTRGSEGVASSDDYDLQLVPAYLPEKEFSDKELPALYRLLSLMEGWTRIFGVDHMTRRSGRCPTANVPDVFDCDFIWSSVSDMAEPFGFAISRQRSLVPFAQRHERSSGDETYPVADCGGVPLWNREYSAQIDKLEDSFRRRWTGITRDQWLYCVEQGRRTRDKGDVVCGSVLFAPTAEKALPVLYAIRDGLANVILLGQPCADKALQILLSTEQPDASGANHAQNEQRRPTKNRRPAQRRASRL